MEKRIQAVLDQYAARNEAETPELYRLSAAQFEHRKHEFLLPTGPAVGTFLNLLIKGSGARTVLELGTSYGYTSIYLGEAVRATGGRVITTELEPAKIAYARAMHAEAGLADVVEVRQGDARQLIADAPETFDLVLVDLWKDLYVECLELFFPKLAPGAYIVADNMINMRDAAMPYRKAIRTKPHIDTVLLPLGHGIEVSRYKAGLDQWEIAART